jgi:hypothetical protein
MIFEEWGERFGIWCVVIGTIFRFCVEFGNEVDYPNDPYSHPVLDGVPIRFTQPIFGGYKKSTRCTAIGRDCQTVGAVVKKYDKSRPTTPDWQVWLCRTKPNILLFWTYGVQLHGEHLIRITRNIPTSDIRQ